MDSGQDGERFLDEAETPIPPRETWGDMSVMELISVKAQLEDKLWSFGNKPTIARVLQQGINQLDALISLQSSSAF